MTSRMLSLLAAVAMVVGLTAAPVGARTTTADDLDLDRIRAAQAAAAEEVGPVPSEVGEYFADTPAHLFHARNDELDLPKVLHASVEDLPAMQEQLRSYLAKKYRAQSAAAKAAGQPMLFRVPVLMFGIHGDQWLSDSSAERFETMLSGTGTSDTGSVTELYREMSFGQMEVDFDVFGPYDSVVSNAPGNQCFYGTYGSPVTGDMVGLGGGGARGMAAEAVPMADPDVDFGQYDNDLDGAVDFLIILHSGPDAAATGDPCHVWSHYFGPLVDDPKEPTMLTSDRNAAGEPVYVSPVMTIPEVDLQIGVTAHELMHALGEPDYYGTAGTAGTGDWDLGAGGSWSGIPAQTNPVHFNPVMKINFGWVEPTRVDATTLGQRLRPRASYPDLIQVPIRTAEPGSVEADLCDQAPVGVPGQNTNFYDEDGNCLVEGFLLEYVSSTSARFDGETCTIAPADFDRQLYGSGLMVWHWDFTNYQSLGNNKVLRPMLDIEEFDGRDHTQDLATGATRSEPRDPFWGDVVGLSSATQIAPGGEGGDFPEPQSWTVSSPPTGGAVAAEPIPEWEAADVTAGTAMSVELSWDVPTDDWDLAVERQLEDGEWVEVGSSAGGAPQTSEQVVVMDHRPGDRYRALAYNWLGPTSPQATVTVSYDASSLTRFGPAGTRDNDLERTGWAFTNLGPEAQAGLAHALAQPRAEVTLDLVRHDDTTVDVSGDVVRPVQDAPAPVVAAEPVELSTVVYNHGGAPVTGAEVAVYAGDPDDGGRLLHSDALDLAGYDRQPVSFSATLAEGRNQLYVRTSVPAGVEDLSPGNDTVRSELRAGAGDGRLLIVDNDRGWTREQAYEATLNAIGVPYDVVEGEPSPETLASYDAVVWITTTVSGATGVLSSAAQEAITAYLDGGGRLWMASTRVGGYAEPGWLGQYFGIEVTSNLLDSMGAIHGVGDDIGDTRRIAVDYLDGRPYWDYGRLATDVKGQARTLFVHSERPENAVATKVTGENGFRTVFGLPLAIVEDARERWRLTSEILDFLEVDRGDATVDGLEVRFERFQHVQIGEDRPVTVGAVGPEPIERVQLVHRPWGAAEWRSIDLTPVTDGLYGGVLPGDAVGNNGIEYFVRVTAGGTTVDVDGGSSLPDVASAPYGDPVEADYCPATEADAGDGAVDDRRGRPDDVGRPGRGGSGGSTMAAAGDGVAAAPDATLAASGTLPVTGGAGWTGLAVALLALAGATSLRRRPQA